MLDRFDRFLKSQGEKNAAEAEEVLELLKDSQYAKQLKLQRDAARMEKQKALASRREALRSQREKEIPELRAKLAKSEADERKLEEALKEARNKRSSAAGEASNRSFWFDHQEAKVLTEIKSSAPAFIDDFKSELLPKCTTPRECMDGRI